ncbi:MAG: O-antigen ligase family protein, partial [Elusimicrobiota bacterium]|nr:O-antigen ligase family protein [Elusimicrobiota bacterium]
MNAKLLSLTGAAFKVFFILCVFVSPLIFFTSLTRNPFDAQTFVLAAGAGALLFLWALRCFGAKEIVLKYTAADYFFAAFIFTALLSTAVNYFASTHPAAVLNEFIRKGHVLITNVSAGFLLAKAFAPYDGQDNKTFARASYLAAWGFLWLFFPAFKMQGVFDVYAILVWCAGVYLCFKILKHNNIKEVLDIFIAVAALAAFYGVMQNRGADIFWSIDISGQFGARAVSTFGNPNFLSSYILLFLPLAAVYFLKAQKTRPKVYYFAVVLLFCAYLAVSAARSSWLGALAGFAALVLFKEVRSAALKNKIRSAVLLFCAVLVFALWPAQTGGGRYASAAAQRVGLGAPKNLSLNAAQGEINQSYHQRLMMWACALEAAGESPVLGKGWGGYQMVFGPCQGRLILKYPPLSFLHTQANAAHNEFMEVLAQSGFAGLFIYLAFFALLLFTFLKAYKNFNAQQRLFYAALFAGAGAMLADNMLNITLQSSITAFAFWFIISSLNQSAAKIKKIKARAGVLFILNAFCLAAFVLLVFWQARRINAAVKEFKAQKLFVLENFALAAKEARGIKTAEAYYLLVNSLIKTGDYDAAAAAAKEGAERFPSYHEFYFRLAAIAAARDELGSAVQNLRQTLLLYPAYQPAAAALGEALLKNPPLAQGENLLLLERVARVMPYADFVNLRLAAVYLANGRAAEAKEAAAKILKTDNFNPDARDVLAAADALLGVKEDALLQKAQKLAALKKQLADPQFLT